MATLKQLRRRIRSVQSTRQITKAMEMVAAAKLKRAQERVVSARPYASRIATILQNLAAAGSGLNHPLFEQREVQNRALVVIASDKGLCGSHNMGIFRAAEKRLEGQDRAAIRIIPCGRRACQYFGKRGWNLPYVVPELQDQADPNKARALAIELVRMFLAGEVDLVEVLYTRFISTMSRRIVVEPVLPIAGRPESEGRRQMDYIFEPSPEAIYATLLPRYVENRIYQAMAESLASEHAARMTSMGAATMNADDVINHLTLVRNRLRQAAITREISEIVGGADALK